MGWNELFLQKKINEEGSMMEDGRSPLFSDLSDEFYLYFVHSFHAVCEDKYAIGKTHYGYEFVSAVQNGNIYGIQPHPEKSHKNGLKIIENFAKM
jgi:glutamine amidotransferase